MLNDSVEVLRTRSSGGGVRDNMSSPSRTTLGPRSISGDGDGRGRIDPLRGGGDNTVMCCGERSCGGGRGGRGYSDGLYGPRGGDRGTGGNECGDNTGGQCLSSSKSASPNAASGGTVATGVSPSRLRKSASETMFAMCSQIGVAGMDVGISSVGSTGGMTVAIAGGGGVERPEG